MREIYQLTLFVCIINTAVYANTLPYFTGSTEVFETKILVGQKFQYSIDTAIAMTIDSIKSDSSFICRDNSCVWNYTYTYDTAFKINVKFFQQDSFTFLDTLVFSFFDAENDSCRFHVRLLDAFGSKSPPDSVWGDLYARPGTGKSICFTSRLPPAGYRQFIIGMSQIDNSTDTVFDTVAAPSRVTLHDLVATDSLFLQKISGKWRSLFCTYSDDKSTNPLYNPLNYAMASDTVFSIFNLQ